MRFMGCQSYMLKFLPLAQTELWRLSTETYDYVSFAVNTTNHCNFDWSVIFEPIKIVFKRMNKLDDLQRQFSETFKSETLSWALLQHHIDRMNRRTLRIVFEKKLAGW